MVDCGGHVVGRTPVKTLSILCTSNEKLVTALAILILALVSQGKKQAKNMKCINVARSLME